MKKIILIVLVLFLCLNAKAQNTPIIKGKVITEKQEPIAGAIVTLLNGNKALIAGTATDSCGYFELQQQWQKDMQLRIQYTGYTLYQKVLKSSDAGEIRLNEDENMLPSIEVLSPQKNIRMRGTKLEANIAGTSLGKMGNILRAMEQLPFVSVKNGKIELSGRGEPLIFLNHRKVRNINEIKSLRTEQIKKIEIELAPGAEYSNEVKAVLYIYTNRLNTLFSGNLNSAIKYQHNVRQSHAGNVIYHGKKLELFGTASYDEFYSKNGQDLEMIFKIKNHPIRSFITGAMTADVKTLYLQSGFVYAWDKKQEIGGDYAVEVNTKGGSIADITQSIFKKNVLEEKQFNHILIQQARPTWHHDISLYYYHKLDKGGMIKLEANYYKTREENQHSSNIKYTINTTNPLKNVLSEDTRNNNVWSFKAFSEIPFSSSKLSFGSEWVETYNHQVARMKNEILEKDFPDVSFESKFRNISPFISFQTSFAKHFILSAGIRMDNTYNIFKKNGIEIRDATEKKTTFSPKLSLSFNRDKFTFNLNYKYTIKRPSYFSLRAAKLYIDNYSYETGNPLLKAARIQDLNAIIAYKDLTAILYSGIIKNSSNTNYMVDEKREMLKMGLSNRDLIGYGFKINYSPKIGIWHPTFSVAYRNIRTKHYEYFRPYQGRYTFSTKQALYLPKKWIITAYYFKWFDGFDKESYKQNTAFLKAGISKRFKKNIDVELLLQDIIPDESSNKMVMNGVSFYKSVYVNKPTVMFKLTYTFNNKRSKYKAVSAGEKEKSRM